MALHSQLDDMINRVLPVVQQFHSKAMFAPHAATVDMTGDLAGRALTTAGTTQLSVSQAIDHFESTFGQLAETGKIQASGIFYHSSGIDGTSGRVSLPPANDVDECRTVVALLEHVSGDSIYLVVPYTGLPPSIEYSVGKLIEKPIKVFINRQTPTVNPWWKFW